MAILKYQDQSSKALMLQLVQGAVDKKLLTVLCTGSIKVPYGNINAGIIGASHYLEFVDFDGKVLFTEVFACVDIGSDNQVYSGDLRDASSIRKHFDNLTYDFKSRAYGWDRGEVNFLKLTELVDKSINQFQFGLQFSFPCEDQLEFPPVTLVHVKADPIKLDVEVRTIHAYPNEGVLVFTETKLQQKK